MSKYDEAVEKGKDMYARLSVARQKAEFIKRKAVQNLDKYLIDFQERFEKNGGKVIFADDAAEAIHYILEIAERSHSKKVVKSKSMITEEIALNEALGNKNIETVETDLGEYIVQTAGEKPYHIVTPAMHKSKEDIATLFHEKFGLDPQSTPEEITGFVREKLRKIFTDADIGITGANFIIADPGAVALTENEGNGMMSFSFPPIHIVVSGIEKIIPSLTDLDVFWPLLSTHGTGQYITVYNSILSGPARENEQDGPREMYVILLNNGRTRLLSRERHHIALSCIRCGACLNACPVYRNIGGYTYASTYSGPIGSVITPYMKAMDRFGHLSYASSLCGKCTEACPVNIPLHELLLLNRNEFVKQGHADPKDKMTMKGWRVVMKNRSLMNIGSSRLKNYILKSFFKKTWGPHRTLPEISRQSFNKMWKTKKNR